MGNRRLIFLGVLCALCLSGSAGWIYYLHSQWSTPERLILRAAEAVQNDDLGRAQVLIRNAIKQAPENVQARIQIANILNALSKERRMGDVPAAVEQIAHAAQLTPDDLELQTRLFFGWHHLGRKQVALKTARKVVDLGSQNAIALIYVIDSELNDGQLESAGKLIDRLAATVSEDSIAVIARRLQLASASEDDAQLRTLCDSFVTRLTTARNADLAALSPAVVAITPSVIARHVQKAPDGEATSRSVAAMELIRRLLSARPETENLWSLVKLTEGLVTASDHNPETDPVARRKLHHEFVQTGEWLLDSKYYPRHLSPEFTVLLYRSAMVSEAPEFAVGILPRLLKNRDGDESWKPTDGQRNAWVTYHAMAMARIFGTDAENDARAGIDQLQQHSSTASMSRMLQALLAAHDGDTDQAHEHLDQAAEDTGIDRLLILALRCRCDMQAGNWKEFTDAITRLELIDVDERQQALLQAMLGSPERRRLLQTMALLESGQVEDADQALKSLDGTEFYAFGHLIRIQHELRQSRIVRARELLDSAREADPTRTEFVIADVAIAAAAGRPGEIESRMIGHLTRYPDDVRVRMLLARWYQFTSRPIDAVTQYRELIQIRPQALHAWVMTAFLLQTSGRQRELDAMLRQMADTPEVAAHALRLRSQMVSFAIRLRRNGSDFNQAIEAVDLLHEDSSQSAADWKLMVIALRATSGNKPLRVIAQLEFAADRKEADTDADLAILDRLEDGMLVALSDIAETDAADMEQRINELVEQHPTQSGPRIAAIVYFANQNDVATAWKHAQALAQIDSQSGRAQYWLARLLALSYRTAEAADLLQASLQLADRPDARLFGARLELFRHQPQEALEHLDRMPATLTGQVVPVLLRFEALRRLDRHARAAAALTDLLQREPQHVAIWLRLSEHLERESGGQQAISLASTALQHHPHHGGLRSKLITLLVRHDRLEQARTLAVQLVETPDHPETPLSLAITFLTAGAIKEGDAWLKKVDADHAPPFQYAMAIYQQGKVHKDHAQIERAGGLLEQLANDSPNSLPVLNNLAWLLAVDLGRPDAALPIVERMLTLSNPGELDPTLVDTIAEVLIANGRAAEALTIVRKSVLQHPDDGVLRYHSGVLQISLARNTAQTGSALHDLALARRWAQLSSRRDAYAAAILEQYGARP